jgi:hypothetical protein
MYIINHPHVLIVFAAIVFAAIIRVLLQEE